VTKLEKISLVVIIILATLNILFFLMNLVSPLTLTEAAGVWWYKAIHKFQNYDKKELENLHLKAEGLSHLNCISCHGLKATEKGTQSIHAIHLPSPENDFKCTDCHIKVEFDNIVGKEPKRKVNVLRCSKCHEEKKDFARVGPEAPEDHEDEAWPKRLHGQTALKKGEQSCFECHEHGLNFCEDCHRLKPYSHANNWKLTHKEPAKEIPENCYYCHKVTFCRACHIKHTDDWINLHQKAVQERGSQQCLHCHVLSYCTDCHKKQVGKHLEIILENPT
jgi:hypothetical protein